MRYVVSKYAENQLDMAYRFYVSDSLYYMRDNKRLAHRYEEIIKPRPRDNRTADQIAQDVIKTLGLKVE